MKGKRMYHIEKPKKVVKVGDLFLTIGERVVENKAFTHIDRRGHIDYKEESYIDSIAIRNDGCGSVARNDREAIMFAHLLRLCLSSDAQVGKPYLFKRNQLDQCSVTPREDGTFLLEDGYVLNNPLQTVEELEKQLEVYSDVYKEMLEAKKSNEAFHRTINRALSSKNLGLVAAGA
jgi:hypothetical protein